MVVMAVGVYYDVEALFNVEDDAVIVAFSACVDENCFFSFDKVAVGVLAEAFYECYIFFDFHMCSFDCGLLYQQLRYVLENCIANEKL